MTLLDERTYVRTLHFFAVTLHLLLEGLNLTINVNAVLNTCVFTDRSCDGFDER